MLRVAVDFGARFADVLLWGAGPPRVAKLPMGAGPAAALGAALDGFGVAAREVAQIRIATTVPLNALMARQRARVGLLTTEGFADTLLLGRQNRVALYDPVATSAAPVFLTDPADIHGIGGRIDAQGREVTPLDAAALARAVAALRGCEAVAVCFLFAHLAPEHELRAAEALRAGLPGVPLSLSHQVDPGPREYERTVSTLLDAWLTAVAVPDLRALGAALADRGFAGEVLYGDARGVLLPEAEALARPARLLAGGPAAAARAAAAVAAEAIALDIGSQSADLSVVQEGQVGTVSYGPVAGVVLRQAMADTESVALGGARRVRLDRDQVRFDSGEDAAPILDDALRVAGRLGGDTGAACARLRALDPGTEPDATARRIVATAEALLATEVTRFATRRNIDPTRSALVVMGGCGALLAAGVAALVGLPEVRLPLVPGAAGALGLAGAARRIEAQQRVDLALTGLEPGRLSAILSALDADTAPQAEGFGAPVVSVSVAARPQMHGFDLVLPDRPESGADIAAAFTAFYRRTYGMAPPGPGHLFRIGIHREAASDPPTAGDGDLAAGIGVHVPEGWSLVRAGGGGGWILRQDAP